jgi:hypothetical protein
MYAQWRDMHLWGVHESACSSYYVASIPRSRMGALVLHPLPLRRRLTYSYTSPCKSLTELAVSNTIAHIMLLLQVSLPLVGTLYQHPCHGLQTITKLAATIRTVREATAFSQR